MYLFSAEGALELGEGSFATIDVPGAMSTSTLAMNARGQIVGKFTDSKGAVHGFVATS